MASSLSWRAEPRPASTGNKVDGLGDEGARHSDDGLLHELLETAQGAERGAGVDRADSTRMTGTPGLEQVERFCTAHLADRDAVRTQPQ